MKIYSDSLITNTPLLMISGQTPQDGESIPTSIDEQLDIVIQKIDTLIQENQASKERIVKMNVYLTEATALTAVREKLTAYYGNNKPTMTLVIVAGLVNPAFKVEIDAIVGF